MATDSAIVSFTLQWNNDNSTSMHVLSIDSYNHDTSEDTPNHKWIMHHKIWKGPKGQMQRRKTNHHTTWIYIYVYELYSLSIIVSPSKNGSDLHCWWERLNSKTLKLQPRVLHGGSAQTRSMVGHPHSAAVMMYLWETLTVKLCRLEGLAILVSKA